jgi:hypothetical protein
MGFVHALQRIVDEGDCTATDKCALLMALDMTCQLHGPDCKILVLTD